jgi:ACDE family multidrug resistance protein
MRRDTFYSPDVANRLSAAKLSEMTETPGRAGGKASERSRKDRLMFARRVPEWLRHAPTPTLRGFAALNGFEAVARGMLISVFPLEMYRVLQDASVVSEIYFIVGLLSLVTGLMVPYMTRWMPRRWMYTGASLAFVAGCLTATLGTTPAIVVALALNTIATVTLFVCFNAYVLDYVARVELGKVETMRMFYSAIGWTTGPVLGVALLKFWAPLPFLISAIAIGCMLILFWIMRLGNGKLITKARGPAVNPMAFLGRFFAQPRLIAGWLFAVLRSCGWWVYVVYLPIFAVKSGLGDQLGGIALSITNASLFLTPIGLKILQRTSIRRAVQRGFIGAGVLFLAAGVIAVQPMLAVVALFA